MPRSLLLRLPYYTWTYPRSAIAVPQFAASKIGSGSNKNLPAQQWFSLRIAVCDVPWHLDSERATLPRWVPRIPIPAHGQEGGMPPSWSVLCHASVRIPSSPPSPFS